MKKLQSQVLKKAFRSQNQKLTTLSYKAQSSHCNFSQTQIRIKVYQRHTEKGSPLKRAKAKVKIKQRRIPQIKFISTLSI